MAHERRIVIAFGRFNPPTTGHEAIVTFLTQTAHRMGAEVRIYPSPTTDAKKNPLPFREKVGFLRQLFPHVTINDNPDMNTPFAAYADASAAGYKDITVIVGADRVRDFEKFAAYLLPASSSKYNAAKHIDVSHYRVLAIPRGVGAMSATLMRGYVVANDFPRFLAGTPGRNTVVAKKIFTSLRHHMHIAEQTAYRRAMKQRVAEAAYNTPMTGLPWAKAAHSGHGRNWPQNHLPPHDTYIVTAIENNVVIQSSTNWGLTASQAESWHNHLRQQHPHATIHIENKARTMSQAMKPGDLFKESHEVVPSLKKQGTYAVTPIENNKVILYSMAWDLTATDAVIYANMMRAKHPHATISIETKGGRVSQVLKPGELFKESHEVELKPGTRVKTPYGRGKIVRYDKGDGPHGSPYYIVDVGKHASEKVMAHQLQREDAPMAAPKPPSDVDRLKVRQATDSINLKQRQATELMAAKIRDVETKAREAQTKATAPKSAAVSAS